MAVQNHIHLDLPELLDAQNAPLQRFTATTRTPAPVVTVNVTKSWTGYRHVSYLADSGNNPVRHDDWTFVLRVRKDQLDYLRQLLGHVCSFVDHDHVTDDADHAAYVQSVLLESLSSIESLGPMLDKSNVTLRLQSLEEPT
jgi:hypothetical protein